MGSTSYPSDPPPQQPQYQQAQNNQWLEQQIYAERQRAEHAFYAQQAEQRRQYETAQQAQRQYEDRQRQETAQQEQRRQEEQRRSSNNSGGYSGGSGDSDYVSRRFNYEKEPGHAWLDKSGYKQTGPDTYQHPSGRNYSQHAVETTYPSSYRSEVRHDDGRSVPPAYVEYVIAYGQKQDYGDPSKGHNRVLGEFVVGMSPDEKKVRHINPWGNKP